MNYLDSYADEVFNMSGFTRTVVVQGSTLMDIFPKVPDMSAPDQHARVMIVVNDVMERPILSTMVDLDIAATVAAWDAAGLNPDPEVGATAFKEIADALITSEIINLCTRALTQQCEQHGLSVDESRDMHASEVLSILHDKAMAAFVSDRLMNAAIMLDDEQFNDVQNTLLSAVNMVSDCRFRAATWTPTAADSEGDQ